MHRPFQTVEAARVPRSAFDLTHTKTFDCDAGQLIPVQCDEVVPGDVFKMGTQVLIRANPLMRPFMADGLQCERMSFFVPNRLIWPDWVEFITKGITGNVVKTLPRWDPTHDGNDYGSLWDYFGFPPNVVPQGALPLAFPLWAYNKVWNEFYRDENLQEERLLHDGSIAYANWNKDYFTSALLSQQRGTAPAFPITGTGSAIWASNLPVSYDGQYLLNADKPSAGVRDMRILGYDVPGTTLSEEAIGIRTTDINNNSVDFSDVISFDVAETRFIFQLQKWMERNMRGGVRYTEFLQNHFNVAPRDDTLQRPQFIGGAKTPIVISEVLQTSETNTSPQGNLAGHGIAFDNSYHGTYRVKEFGWIITLMCIRPKAVYTQGINRQFLRRVTTDFYFPEFSTLSEQDVEKAEIYATSSSDHNLQMFGYQGVYDEMRYKPSMVVGNLRNVGSGLETWAWCRHFANSPALNGDFVKCNPGKYVFEAEDQPGWVCQVKNKITAIRPLPVMATPGLIDHH